MTRPGLMIFAAGRGTRMMPLTKSTPKPLVKVAGRPLLDHALDIAKAFKPEKTVVNTHAFSDQIHRHLDGTDIAISSEQTLLDTGGGLKAALPLLPPGPVLTLNSDAIWSGPNPLCALMDAWDPTRMDALLLMLPPDGRIGHKRDGDFRIEEDGQMHRGGQFTYSGAQIIDPAVLSDIPDMVFSLNVAWDRIAARRGLFGLRYPGRWCDVGYPEAIPLAEELLHHA